MKVLMFGWEFPPHISGGLGTACFGITKGLSAIRGLEIAFVVPKFFGGESQNKVKLIAAEETSLKKGQILPGKLKESMDFIEVESKLSPYLSPAEFQKKVKNTEKIPGGNFKTDSMGRLSFSGQYGNDLLGEVGRYALAADTIARDHDFDLIHAHDWLTYPAGIAAKKASGKPLVIHVHATDFDRSAGEANPSVFRIEKMGMEAADKIITVSNLTRNLVIEKYGIKPEKAFTVYNAVEPFESPIGEHSIGKGSDTKIVTFLGRITMQKGPEYFVEVARMLLKKMDNVRFVMAGNGDMMNSIISLVARLGISNKFHFTGFLKGREVYELFRLSDVYVMPSVSEPFGISPLEAMQCKVPVIISRQSGVSELLRHAIRVDFWDTEAMADAIHGILSYPSMSAMMIKHGKVEADGLRWEDSARQIFSIYKSIVAA